MLQRIETVETPLTDASTVAIAETEEIPTEEILPAPVSNAELAELTACIEAGVTRTNNRMKTIQKKIIASSTL